MPAFEHRDNHAMRPNWPHPPSRTSASRSSCKNPEIVQENTNAVLFASSADCGEETSIAFGARSAEDKNVEYPCANAYKRYVKSLEPPHRDAVKPLSPKPHYILTFDPNVNLFELAKHSSLTECRGLVKERKEMEKAHVRNFPLPNRLPLALRHRYNAIASFKELNHQIRMSEKPKKPTPSIHMKIRNSTDKSSGFGLKYVKTVKRVHLQNCTSLAQMETIQKMEDYYQAEMKSIDDALQECVRKRNKHENYLQKLCRDTTEAMYRAEDEAHCRSKAVNEVRQITFLIGHFNVENAKLEDRLDQLNDFHSFIMKIIHDYIQSVRELTLLLRDNHDDWNKAAKNLSIVKKETTSNQQEKSEDTEEPVDMKDIVRRLYSTNLDGLLTDEQLELSDDLLCLAKFHQVEKDPVLFVELFEGLEDTCLVKVMQLHEMDRDIENMRMQINCIHHKQALDIQRRDEHIQHAYDTTQKEQSECERIQLKASKLEEYSQLKRYNKTITYLGQEFMTDMDNGIHSAYHYFANAISEVFHTCILNSPITERVVKQKKKCKMSVAVEDVDVMLQELELEIDWLYNTFLTSEPNLFQHCKVQVLENKRRRQRQEQEARIKAFRQKLFERVKLASQQQVVRCTGRRVMMRSQRPKRKVVTSPLVAKEELIRQYEETVFGIS